MRIGVHFEVLTLARQCQCNKIIEACVVAMQMPLEGVTSQRWMASKTDCWVLTLGHYR